MRVKLADVSDFGAHGDGITDDTEAFQIAIDSLAEGEPLTVRQGRYLISRPLVIRTIGVVMRGTEAVFVLSGSEAVRIEAASVGLVGFRVQSSGATSLQK